MWLQRTFGFEGGDNQELKPRQQATYTEVHGSAPVIVIMEAHVTRLKVVVNDHSISWLERAVGPH